MKLLMREAVELFDVTSARSRSPALKWQNPNASTSLAHWVPLPLPGPPSTNTRRFEGQAWVAGGSGAGGAGTARGGGGSSARARASRRTNEAKGVSCRAISLPSSPPSRFRDGVLVGNWPSPSLFSMVHANDARAACKRRIRREGGKCTAAARRVVAVESVGWPVPGLPLPPPSSFLLLCVWATLRSLKRASASAQASRHPSHSSASVCSAARPSKGQIAAGCCVACSWKSRTKAAPSDRGMSRLGSRALTANNKLSASSKSRASIAAQAASREIIGGLLEFESNGALVASLSGLTLKRLRTKARV
mmetsp:Transcript_75238/g.151258  ORF Transcript_75238/g.151258 Transcript_75238/m.151258 type:complete len:306 (-) Transcript_75238:95-1012(-)